MGPQLRVHSLDTAQRLHDLRHQFASLIRDNSSALGQYLLVCLFWGLILYALAVTVPE